MTPAGSVGVVWCVRSQGAGASWVGVPPGPSGLGEELPGRFGNAASVRATRRPPGRGHDTGSKYAARSPLPHTNRPSTPTPSAISAVPLAA